MAAVPYTLATPAQAADLGHKTARFFPWLLAAALLIAAMGALALVGSYLTPNAVNCAAHCPQGPPPTSPPLQNQATYTSSAYGFSLAYDPNWSFGSPTHQDATSVSWQGTLTSGGQLDVEFAGMPANARSSGAIVDTLQQRFPQFQAVYPVPGAEIGYVGGTGGVYEGVVTPASGGQSETDRLVLMAAVQNNVGVTMVCSAPRVPDTSDHPDPVRLGASADQFCDTILNTVTWKGEPPL